MALLLQRIEGVLPVEVSDLAVSAQQEGFSHVARLVTQWNEGFRFARSGEILMGVWHDGILAAIGGVTIDPAHAEALRMRRFYVRPDFRRQGIGRLLAQDLLHHALSSHRPVFVHAGTAVAPMFWEALGFSKHEQDGHTHQFLPI
jgi:GNAT superfamily N-acetyltransferase